MATSSLTAYTGSISISSTNLNRNHQWENEVALQSSLFFNSPLKTSTTAQFLNKQLTLSVSSTPRPLTIISMAPPKPGGKPRKRRERRPRPALGAKGVNIAAFCKDYNARNADKARRVEKGSKDPKQAKVWENHNRAAANNRTRKVAGPELYDYRTGDENYSRHCS